MHIYQHFLLLKKKPRLKTKHLYPLNDLLRLDPNYRIEAKRKKNPKQITIISIKQVNISERSARH